MSDYISKYTGMQIDQGLNPVGTVISFMGLTAPEGYLACDGSIKNVKDYPNLAQHFINQFGDAGYFGGDGSLTFALPDMRGEFVRGYDPTKQNDPQGDKRGVGKHQDGTYIPSVRGWNGGALEMGWKDTTGNSWNWADNIDKSFAGSHYIKITEPCHSINTTQTGYIARPTNVNALFCIKY